jgi:hypothetical protein
MYVAAGIFLFVLGLGMLTAGIALFINGEVTFRSGKKIPKPLSRKVAWALVSFFPALLCANFLLRLVDREKVVPAAVINWPIAVICLGLALSWLWRGLEGTSAPGDQPPPASPF